VQLAAKKFIWIAAIVLPMLSGAHADQSRIVSIKETQQYQNPTLLKQAWALPVAVLYQSGIEYQRNASVCAIWTSWAFANRCAIQSSGSPPSY